MGWIRLYHTPSMTRIEIWRKVAAMIREEIANVPTLFPRDGEVRIKMQAVGICGSDVHLYLGHRCDLI